MKNNPLSMLSALLTGVLITQLGGCATAESAPASEPVAASVSASSVSASSVASVIPDSSLTIDEGQASGITRFTEESIQNLTDDDFWGSGIETQRDEDGRLVFVAKTGAINDPERTRQELVMNRLQRGTVQRVLFIDPVTRQLYTGPGPQTRRNQQRVPSAVPDQRQVRPIRTLPQSPRIAPRIPTSPRNSQTSTERQ